jgi:glycine/sarcosine N-methyltransferase
MEDEVRDFYDTLAVSYRLIFDDWDQAVQNQSDTRGPLLESRIDKKPTQILDCACGIGTQALGFADRGHVVSASDLSPGELEQARNEAHKRGLKIDFYVSNMISLSGVPQNSFDAVVAMDNALPHLNRPEVAAAAKAIAGKLRRGGVFMASIRDYDQLIPKMPSVQPPAFYGKQDSRRVVHQVWEWAADETYRMHLYITTQSNSEWKCLHSTCLCHPIRRNALSSLLFDAGFKSVQWLLPAETRYYQPIVIATIANTSPESAC